MFELFIARRYLRAKRKQVMISVITVISIVGVAAGVMALVIALAINNGFKNTLERNLLGATAHVSILEKEPAGGIEGWQEVAQKLSRLPHVTSASPGLYDAAYLTAIQSAGVEIKGITVGPGAPLPDALRNLKSGSVDGLLAKEDDLPGIILGARLAQSTGAVVGKMVRILIPNGELTPFGPKPSYVRTRVAGIFETGLFDLDSSWAFMRLQAAQKAFGLSDVVNSVELRLDEIDRAPEVARAAEALIGPKLTASTWEEQNRPIFNALRMEKIVSAVTVGLIQIVAALNIVIALVMMVMEKHRDIAVLMSMGARAKQIRNIFVFEGALIGSVGTATGLAVGYVLCYFADRYRWIPLDEQVYSLSFVPFNARWVDGLWIAGVAIAVSLLATLYPARSATRIAPVESLRYE